MSDDLQVNVMMMAVEKKITHTMMKRVLQKNYKQKYKQKSLFTIESIAVIIAAAAAAVEVINMMMMMKVMRQTKIYLSSQLRKWGVSVVAVH